MLLPPAAALKLDSAAAGAGVVAAHRWLGTGVQSLPMCGFGGDALFPNAACESGEACFRVIEELQPTLA